MEAIADTNKMLQESFKAGLKHIDTLVSAVFGNQVGQDEIPKNMRKGEVKNPAVSVFGWGVWLLDNPTENLQKRFERIGDLMVGAVALMR